MAEWLRSGLQSRSHRFDSGRRLAGRTQLRDVYAAFNARDVDAVLDALIVRMDVIDW